MTEDNTYRMIPNFTTFLRERGTMKIGRPTGDKEFRFCFGYTEEIRPVYLNRKKIGTLEFYTNPFGIYFTGHIPDMPRPKGYRGPLPHEIVLSYSEKEGRTTDWTIPFP